MPTDFAAIAPPSWASVIRPYLARANEFQPKQPLISYFLKTHVAFLCIKKLRSAPSTTGGKEGSDFLMKFMKELEQEQQTLKSELDKCDGRTVLTRTALMLFTRADDSERQGTANLSIVKMFFTASILFEATGQFLDGQLDPLATEKVRYAKFVATKMKKCLDQGIPYTSHNPSEGIPTDELPGDTPVAGPPQSSPLPAQPVQPQGPHPPATYTQPPPPPAAYHPAPPPAFPSPPLPAAAALPPPPAQPPQPQAAAPLTYQDPGAVHPKQTPPAPVYIAPPVFNSGSTAPSMDAMIDAQKLAKLAVSALQFYDYENARKQLTHALQLLGGTSS